MAERSRKSAVLRTLFVIALLYGLVLFLPGISIAQEWIRNPSHRSIEWQERTFPLLILSFFPLILAGAFFPRTSAILLWCGFALCVIQVLGIPGAAAGGFAVILLGAVFWLGLPMLLAGALFYFVDPRERRTRSIVSR